MSLTLGGDACARVHQDGKGKYVKIGQWFTDSISDRLVIKLDTLPLVGAAEWTGWINLFKKRESSATPAVPEADVPF